MNHTSLCDTSLCDTNLFYVLLTRPMSIVTTCHPCLLDEHQISLCEQAFVALSTIKSHAGRE